MLRKFACAVAVLLVGSIALAETIRGVITAVDKEKGVTITPFKKGEKGEAKTYPFAGTYTISKVKGKGKDAEKEKIELSAFTKEVEKASDSKFKGLFGSVEVTDGKVTAINYGGRGKGKKKKTDD
jgi:hypothetical protein